MSKGAATKNGEPKKNSARAARHSAGSVEGCRIIPQGFALRAPKLDIDGVSFAMTLA